MEQIRKNYILSNLVSKEHFIDKFNFTIFLHSFGSNSYNLSSQEDNFDENGITINLPHVDLTDHEPPHIRIDTSEPGAFELMPSLRKIMVSRGIVPNEDNATQDLWVMDRFGNALPNRQITYSNFFKFNDKNLTGLMSEYTYYHPTYSEVVNGKSVSFIVNNNDLSFSLVSKPSDYAIYEKLFDMMVLSLKFY